MIRTSVLVIKRGLPSFVYPVSTGWGPSLANRGPRILCACCERYRDLKGRGIVTSAACCGAGIMN